jgi:hypothetical protein
MNHSYHITQQIEGDEHVLHTADAMDEAVSWAQDHVASRSNSIELSISWGARIVALVTRKRLLIVPVRGARS